MLSGAYTLELEPCLMYHRLSDLYYNTKHNQRGWWLGEDYTFEEIEDYLKEHHYEHWCSRKLGLDY